MRTFLKASYYVVYVLSVIILFWTYNLFAQGALNTPFCPVLVVIVMCELSFFADGLIKNEDVIGKCIFRIYPFSDFGVPKKK
jgi:hypothetical protein